MKLFIRRFHFDDNLTTAISGECQAKPAVTIANLGGALQSPVKVGKVSKEGPIIPDILAQDLAVERTSNDIDQGIYAETAPSETERHPAATIADNDVFVD